MHNTKLILLATLLTLTGCASTTPIAVSTPQWVVPPVDKEIQVQEAAASSEMEIALQAWSKWLLTLPSQVVAP